MEVHIRAHMRTHPNVVTKWFSTAVHKLCWNAGKVHVARYAVGSFGFGWYNATPFAGF
jgi:hypothetical protein